MKSNLSFKRLICVSLSLSQILSTSLTSLVAADLRVRDNHIVPLQNDPLAPQIEHSANGREAVNILNPNSKGISHNKYESFDIAKDNGVILNNSMKNGVSLTGGVVNANPHLSSEARLIINEIVSKQQTSLEGTLEVFGKNADVIIANENGMVVNGATFINTSGVTLTTGLIDRFNNQINVRGGNISILERGVGLDGDYFSIISQSMQLAGNISKLDGKPLDRMNYIAGLNNVKLDSAMKDPQVVSTLQSGAKKPELAIDGDMLGSMYAGYIKFLSTQEGVGVQHKGVIKSASDIVIDANGDILTSALIAQNITFKTSSNVMNDGVIIGNKNLDIKAKALTNKKDINKEAISKTKLDLKESHIQAENVNLNLEKLDNQGKMIGLEALNVKSLGASSSVENSGDMISKNIKIQTNAFKNNVSIASNNLDIQASDLKNLAQSTLKADELKLNTTNFENQGTLNAKNAEITNSQKILNDGLMSINSLKISSDEFLNTGEIKSAYGTFKTTTFSNKGDFTSGFLSLESTDLINTSDLNTYNANLDISLLTNTGKIASENDFIINFKDNAKSLNQVLQNEKGTLSSKNNLKFQSGAINLDGTLGKIIAEGKLAFSTDKDIAIQKDFINKGSLELKALGNITNNASVLLASSKDIYLGAKAFLNNSNAYVFGENIKIEANDITNNENAVIDARNTLSLKSNTLTNNVATLNSGSDLSIITNTLNNNGITNGDLKFNKEANLALSYYFAKDYFGNRQFSATAKTYSIQNNLENKQAIIKSGGNLYIQSSEDKKNVDVYNRNSMIAAKKDIQILGNVYNTTMQKGYDVGSLLQNFYISDITARATYLGGGTYKIGKGGAIMVLNKAFYASDDNQGYFGLIKDLAAKNDLFKSLMARAYGADWIMAQNPWQLKQNYKYNPKALISFTPKNPAQILAGNHIVIKGGTIYNSTGSESKINTDIDKIKTNLKDVQISDNLDTSTSPKNPLLDPTNTDKKSGDIFESISLTEKEIIDLGKSVLFQVKEFDPNVAINYYIETRPDLVDMDKFYGAQYLFSQIGYNPQKPLENKPSIEKSSDKPQKVVENKPSIEKPTESKILNQQPSNKPQKLAESKPLIAQIGKPQKVAESKPQKVVENKPSIEKPTGNKPQKVAESKPLIEKPSDKSQKVVENKPLIEKPAGDKPQKLAESKSLIEKPSDKSQKLVENKPSIEKPAGDKPQKVVENKPLIEKPAGNKPQKVAESKPLIEKPSDKSQKLVENKPSIEKPAGDKPQKLAESKSLIEKPSDKSQKLVENKPSIEKPAGDKPQKVVENKPSIEKPAGDKPQKLAESKPLIEKPSDKSQKVVENKILNQQPTNKPQKLVESKPLIEQISKPQKVAETKPLIEKPSDKSQKLVESKPLIEKPAGDKPQKLAESKSLTQESGDKLPKPIWVIGDAYYENKLLNEQLTKNLGYTNTLSPEDVKNLLDKAADMSKKLGLVIGKPLSQEQIKQLDDDIIWYVSEEIGGREVLVPQLYFSKNTSFNKTDEAKNSTIASSGNMFLQTGSFKNDDGSFIAGGSLGIKSVETQNLGGVIAAQNISIDTNKLISESKIDIDEKGNLTTVQQASISANKDINIQTQNDMIIKNSLVSSQSNKGEINLVAKDGSIQIVDDEVHTTHYVQTQLEKDDYLEVNTTTQKQTFSSGSLISGNTINIQSSKDLTLKGSSLSQTTKEGSINVSSLGDVNIVSGTSETHSESNRYFSGVNEQTGMREYGTYGEATQNSKEALASSIKASGDVNIVSQNNLNIESSAINSGGKVTLNALSGEVALKDAQNVSTLNTSDISYQVLGIKGGNQTVENSTSSGSKIKADEGLTIASKGDIHIVGSDLEAKDIVLSTEGKFVAEAGKSTSKVENTSFAFGIIGRGKAGIASSEVSAGFGIDDNKNFTSAQSAFQPQALTSGKPQLDSLASSELGLEFSWQTATQSSTTYKNGNLKTSNGDLVISAARSADIGGTNMDSASNIVLKAEEILSSKYTDEVSSHNFGFSIALTQKSSAVSAVADTVNMISDVAVSAANKENLNGGFVAAQAAGAVTNLIFNDLIGGVSTQEASFQIYNQDSHKTSENINQITAAKGIQFESTKGNIELSGVKMKADSLNLISAKDITISNAKETLEENGFSLGLQARVQQTVGYSVLYGSNGDVGVGGGFNFAYNQNSEQKSQASEFDIKNQANIKAQNDFSLIGSKITAGSLNADIGGDLRIISVVDTKNSQNANANLGADVSLGGAQNTIAKGDVSLNAGAGHYHDNSKSVGVQAGIVTQGELNINTKGDALLEGAILSSATKQGGLNIGGALTINDLDLYKDKAGGSASLSGGMSGNFGGHINLGDSESQTSRLYSAVDISVNAQNVTINGAESSAKDIYTDTQNSNVVLSSDSYVGGNMSFTGNVHKIEGLFGDKPESIQPQHQDESVVGLSFNQISDSPQGFESQLVGTTNHPNETSQGSPNSLLSQIKRFFSTENYYDVTDPKAPKEESRPELPPVDYNDPFVVTGTNGFVASTEQISNLIDNNSLLNRYPLSDSSNANSLVVEGSNGFRASAEHIADLIDNNSLLNRYPLSDSSNTNAKHNETNNNDPFVVTGTNGFVASTEYIAELLDKHPLPSQDLFNRHRSSENSNANAEHTSDSILVNPYNPSSSVEASFAPLNDTKSSWFSRFKNLFSAKPTEPLNETHSSLDNQSIHPSEVSQESEKSLFSRIKGEFQALIHSDSLSSESGDAFSLGDINSLDNQSIHSSEVSQESEKSLFSRIKEQFLKEYAPKEEPFSGDLPILNDSESIYSNETSQDSQSVKEIQAQNPQQHHNTEETKASTTDGVVRTKEPYEERKKKYLEKIITDDIKFAKEIVERNLEEFRNNPRSDFGETSKPNQEQYLGDSEVLLGAKQTPNLPSANTSLGDSESIHSNETSQRYGEPLYAKIEDVLPKPVAPSNNTNSSLVDAQSVHPNEVSESSKDSWLSRIKNFFSRENNNNLVTPKEEPFSGDFSILGDSESIHSNETSQRYGEPLYAKIEDVLPKLAVPENDAHSSGESIKPSGNKPEVIYAKVNKGRLLPLESSADKSSNTNNTSHLSGKSQGAKEVSAQNLPDSSTFANDTRSSLGDSESIHSNETSQRYGEPLYAKIEDVLPKPVAPSNNTNSSLVDAQSVHPNEVSESSKDSWLSRIKNFFSRENNNNLVTPKEEPFSGDFSILGDSESIHSNETSQDSQRPKLPPKSDDVINEQIKIIIENNSKADEYIQSENILGTLVNDRIFKGMFEKVIPPRVPLENAHKPSVSDKEDLKDSLDMFRNGVSETTFRQNVELAKNLSKNPVFKKTLEDPSAKSELEHGLNLYLSEIRENLNGNVYPEATGLAKSLNDIYVEVNTKILNNNRIKEAIENSSFSKKDDFKTILTEVSNEYREAFRENTGLDFGETKVDFSNQYKSVEFDSNKGIIHMPTPKKFKEIYFSKEASSKDIGLKTLEAAMHEMTHKQQDFLIENKDSLRLEPVMRNYANLLSLNKEFYIKGEDNFNLYQNQIIEKEAFTYGQETAKSFQNTHRIPSEPIRIAPQNDLLTISGASPNSNSSAQNVFPMLPSKKKY